MLQRNDLVLLLTELSDEGVNVEEQWNKLFNSPNISMEVLKFINDNRQLDVTEFYKHIRKTYNKKKSKLYKNIVDEVSETDDLLTTLASFSLQVLLYSNKIEDKQSFLKHARFEEVERCLHNYAVNYDLVGCRRVLQLIHADCKAFESLYRTND